MRYWVYINDKVEGPFEEDKLVTLKGFTPETLICSEDAASGGNQEWVKASSVFEFDQVAAQQPAAQAAQPAQNASGMDGLAALLLSKLDALSGQLTGMQSKLDGMQTKLDGMQTKIDEAARSAQQARDAVQPAPAAEFVPPQEGEHSNTITLTHHDLAPETNEDALITNTESLVSKAEDIVAAANKTQEPLDMLGAVDLGDKPAEEAIGANAGEDLVISSAMDSLYNARTLEQTQEEKESTFQDLLTPAQARDLAAQAQAVKEQTKTLDQALAESEQKDTAKDALIAELTVEPQENVLDQVIKEKEEEKKAETLRMAAGAAVAAAGAAALAAAANKQEEPAEKQTLDFNQNQEPALSIATDAANPEQKEEVLPASAMPADEPAAPAAIKDAAQTVQEPQNAPKEADLPSLDDMGTPAETEKAAEAKEETLQELVPGATAEKPEGVLITDADLKDAFTERDSQSDQTVEQLFGIGQSDAPAEAAQSDPQDQALPSLDSFNKQTSDQPLPVGNPNDLTEIELKEGSTYLISDFVPPAQADANALPKELTGLSSVQPASEKPAENQADAFTEIVASTKQTEKTVETPQNAPSDVTVSQVILENTIKTKRGATLDIKTVPMVPEPAQSERLHIDGLEDDINAQHDLKTADEKPAGKTKMLVGVLAAIVLAVLIYLMLAFMNLIPAQFNVLASNKTQNAQAAEQDARMEEMLGTEPVPAEYQEPAAPQQPAVNPMDTALEEVKNYPLVNGFTLKEFIEAKHPAAVNLITWDISTAVDPDNYSVIVKVPPENPQSFKISYRFNYNTVTKALDPTISDAKNLLDLANQGAGMPAANAAQQPAPAM